MIAHIKSAVFAVRPGLRLRPPGLGGVFVFALAGVLLLPFVWLLHQAVGGGFLEALDGRMALRSFGVTAVLVGGTLALALAIGVTAGWLCVMCRFPGSESMKVCLLLPLTMPPYLLAYVYAELFEGTGLGFFRGMTGAVLSLSLATYPYVFLFSTIAFILLPCHLFSTSRVLGHTPMQTFFKVSLPIARPAIIAGLALVMMETIGDFGVAEYFGLPTLSVAVYDVWLNRGDFAQAAQLSLLTMLAIFAVLVVERMARMRHQHYTHRRRDYCCDQSYQLEGGKRWLALAFCIAVLSAAFGIPLLRLCWLSLNAGADAWLQILRNGATNSFMLALAVSVLTLVLGALLGLVSRADRGRRSPLRAWAAKASLTGYAFPGTILALAVLGVSYSLADLFAAAGFNVKPLLAATVLMLCLGLTIKFVIITYSACDAGLRKIPPSMSSAARLNGMGTLETIVKVHLPLIRPALLAALMLVFVDVTKELPLTLLLRPLGFDTLSTYVFQYASDEELRRAAPSGLLLVVLGFPAMIVLRRFMEQQWRGSAADAPR